MNATHADIYVVENEIREIMRLLGKYAIHNRQGVWLKLRKGVLADKSIWIDRKAGAIDIAAIADALWDAFGLQEGRQ
jgi:hypothetical protein